MTLLSLLSRRATVFRYSRTGARDGHGIKARVLVDTIADVPCALEQTDPREVLIGQETYISTHRAAFLGGQPLDGSDEVEVEGVRFEVIGDPSRGFTPAGEHHVEAVLRQVR